MQKYKYPDRAVQWSRVPVVFPVRPDVLPRRHNCVRQTDGQVESRVPDRRSHQHRDGFRCQRRVLLGLMKDVQGLRAMTIWALARPTQRLHSVKAAPYAGLGPDAERKSDRRSARRCRCAGRELWLWCCDDAKRRRPLNPAGGVGRLGGEIPKHPPVGAAASIPPLRLNRKRKTTWLFPSSPCVSCLKQAYTLATRPQRWNPKMDQYIYGARNGIHIMDLTQTVPMLDQALQVIRDTVAKGGRVLFVGTKRQAAQADHGSRREIRAVLHEPPLAGWHADKLADSFAVHQPPESNRRSIRKRLCRSDQERASWHGA